MDRSQLGIYLGTSQEHAAYVSLVLNSNTGLVSPQFYIIHDDSFSSVSNDPLVQTAHKWQKITRINLVVRKCVLPPRSSTPHCVLPEHTPLTNEAAQPALQREPVSPPVILNQNDSTSSSQWERTQPSSVPQRDQPQPTSDELGQEEDPRN